jgi:TolB-like protein/Flp pilus assembly protein TadD
MTADVFVSYSREDKDRVLSLTSKLREAGISLWIDQGSIDGATMWSEEIVNALENAKVLLLMVTERSVNSHNVVKEVALASERKSHILPIHLEPTHIPASLKYPLAGIQHIEYFQGDQEDNLKNVLRSLERIGVTVDMKEPSAPKKTEIRSEDTTYSSEEDFRSYGNSLAVLPFENNSSDQDSDYFSDGLTDELITNLSKISELQVISRILSNQYKKVKKDIKTIGRELHARYLVAGNVRKHQENLRISAQLIDIATGRELWAEKYKGSMADVFDIQENVSSEIADALKLRLTLTEKVVLAKRSTLSAEAYDLVLRATSFLYIGSRESLEVAVELLGRAIELDVRYAGAYARLSVALSRLYILYVREESYLDRAQEAALMALMYDNTAAEAYVGIAQVQFARGNREEGMRSAERAVQMAPDSYWGYWALARALYGSGQYVRSLEVAKKALELNPEDHLSMNLISMAYDKLGLKIESDKTRERLIEILPTYLAKFPEDNRARMLYASSLARLGKDEKAREIVTKTTERHPNDSLIQYYAACVYTALGDLDKGVEAITRSVECGWKDLDWIRNDPDLNRIHDHPAYIKLMQEHS